MGCCARKRNADCRVAPGRKRKPAVVCCCKDLILHHWNSAYIANVTSELLNLVNVARSLGFGNMRPPSAVFRAVTVKSRRAMLGKSCFNLQAAFDIKRKKIEGRACRRCAVANTCVSTTKCCFGVGYQKWVGFSSFLVNGGFLVLKLFLGVHGSTDLLQIAITPLEHTVASHKPRHAFAAHRHAFFIQRFHKAHVTPQPGRKEGREEGKK